MTRPMNVLQDFKQGGPLDLYRGRARFDWKALKLALETPEVVDYQNQLYAELQRHEEYQAEGLPSASFDEQRRRACRQSLTYKSIELLSIGYQLQNLKFPFMATTVMMQLAPASTIKFNVAHTLFTDAIRTLGTGRHAHFLQQAEEGVISGCYCLTEIAHGSNVKAMRTSAVFDKDKQCFVLNSEGFEAAKCWAGGLGQVATHAIVYAQLRSKQQLHGLHCFVVPIRDPRTLLPFPGLLVGDMGEKIGLNGIDNGFVLFQNYEIPKENLLNKLGDVTEQGDYVTPFKDPSKRHGAALGALSGGRVVITGICAAYGVKALTIAVRYAAVRKQFGPSEQGPEVPILEYQTHFSVDSALGHNKERLPELGAELHAISSASKPLAGWSMRDAIQECREACGGHGYLKVAGLGDIRNDHDANMTYEGENHVLIQQTSNWLLKFWPLVERQQPIATPLRSADFLSRGLEILRGARIKARTVAELCEPDAIIPIYQWLVCHLLQTTHDKLAAEGAKGAFWGRNNCQVFRAKSLGVAFIQHFVLQVMLEKIEQQSDAEIRAVLRQLFSLQALFWLEKLHMATIYQGGLAQGGATATLIQDAVLELCAQLKDQAVALVDAVAPPDFVLNSPLGASDGQVYKHLQAALLSAPFALSRPAWWQDIATWKSKL
ncbi:hypothetical protein D910_04031 [Dendroctonus ponderosae]|uniref:Acyl-coenzyme A oxidase n=1 Tax=Dendroctonus ponderosae TaxID=77166 RepID=U4TYB9_DENPD|nr:hypothetical protein D910_04031 [Dendroctonus ponderosae]